MRKTYKGRYTVANKDKYAGDPSNVIYRSMWERHVCKWCDTNPNVVQWNSEEVTVPYICETDKRPHRYFIDFYIKFKDGNAILVEVKPKHQTEVPKKQGRKKQHYVTEALTYVKNQSKWKAATEYALDRSLTFQIWTEDTLHSLGIMTKTKPVPGKLKKMKPYRKKAKK